MPMLRLVMRGRVVGADNVNQGGLFGLVSTRVFSAASEILFARRWYYSDLENWEETAATNLPALSLT